MAPLAYGGEGACQLEWLLRFQHNSCDFRPAREISLSVNCDFVARFCGSVAGTDFFGGGKILGDFLGDFAGGGPFGATLKGGDETDAFLGGDVGAVVMAKRGMKDTPLAERNGHEQWLVFAGAAGFL